MHPIELIHLRSLKYLSDQLQSLVRGRLWLQVLVGMLLGVVLGVAIGPSAGWVDAETAATVGDWAALPGRVFLGAIQMVVVPLVFASIIRGLAASENMDELRRTGLQAVAFFVATTTLAIVIGIGLAIVVQPGRFLDAASIRAAVGSAQTAAPQVPAGFGGSSVPQALVNLIPSNPLGAMVQGEMLGVVLFAVIMGVALVSLPVEQSQPLLALLGSLQQVSMTIVRWTMWLAPLAVFGLITQLTSKLGLRALIGMSVYVGTVLAGLLLLLLLYLVLAWTAARRSPWKFLRDIREVQLLAFSTSSSAAVMPLSIRTAEEKLGVRPSVSQFVIPLGATINMNGTALYQGVATMFLAQVFGLELTAGQLALVVVTAVAASIGSPATPGVGIVILSMVLGSAGVPVAGIGLIMGVDRILDMSRTAVNVTGDLLATAILDHRAANTASALPQGEGQAPCEAGSP
ncbi:MAG: dicarboxylate/amino acid:cation symporter [Myxococcales bacterium]|nr:dicarboxylate/amino acid:cation symporter [Myxococcales bacterium]